MLTESVFVNGEYAMNMTDTVKYRDGRLTTASPPCPGVTAAGVYGLLKSVVPYGLNYAQMYADGRYKLKMSLDVYRGAPIAIPYSVFSTELPQKICFPAFVGRMSIAPNSTRITVNEVDIAPADSKVIVKSSARPDQPYEFPRSVSPFRLTVTGYNTDTFTVRAVGPGGEQKVTALKQLTEFEETENPIVAIFNPIFQEKTYLLIDPADITIPLTKFRVTANVAQKSIEVDVPDQSVTVSVPGGGSDTHEVSVARGGGIEETVKRVPHTASPAVEDGVGNLVLQASQGTIDPTRAEMDEAGIGGPARTKFTLSSDIEGFIPLDIEAKYIKKGGLAYAFDGKEGATYTVTTEYDSRPPFSVTLPTVRYVIRNVNTSQVIKTIFGQAPPRDQPVEMEPITDDTQPPVLLSGPTRVDTFDPAGLLTFQFSESMNPSALKSGIKVLKGSKAIEGEIRVSDLNRVATFVPTVPLELGEVYKVRIAGGAGTGITDLAGNALAQSVEFDITTFAPRSLGVEKGGDTPGLFKDVAWFLRDNGVEEKRYLFATLGGFTANVRSFDATDPSKLEALTSQSGQVSQQRIALLETSKLPVLGGAGKEVLVATTNFNPDSSAITFYRATDPAVSDRSRGHDALGQSRDLPEHRPPDREPGGVRAQRGRARGRGRRHGVRGAREVRRRLARRVAEHPEPRAQRAAPERVPAPPWRRRSGDVCAAHRRRGSRRRRSQPRRSPRALARGAGRPNHVAGRAHASAVGRSRAHRSRQGRTHHGVRAARRGRGRHPVRLDDRAHRLCTAGGRWWPAPPTLTSLFNVPLYGPVVEMELDEERGRVIAIVREDGGDHLYVVDLQRG